MEALPTQVSLCATIQNATKTRERVNWKATPWWLCRITQGFETCTDCLGFEI